MSSTVDGPVTISPEATARVAELGLQREFEQIVEHTRRSIPGLQRIEVTLAPAHDTGGDPRVILDAFLSGRESLVDPTFNRWRDWVLATFPPDVWRHFMLLTVDGPGDGR